MLWNRIVSFLLGGSLLVAHPLTTSDSEPVSVNEVMTYECARDVASLADVERPAGPLFSAASLLVTSIEDAALHPQLVVSAGGGVYSLELPHEGLNRMRFDLLDQSTRKVVTYYLGYMHDARLGSRLLEFGADQPPTGHFEFDYLSAIPKRAASLLPHLEYAIFTTSAKLRHALIEGRVRREQVHARTQNSCDHLARENPSLALSLQNNLEYFDKIAGPPTRLPASLR